MVDTIILIIGKCSCIYILHIDIRAGMGLGKAMVQGTGIL